MKTQSLNDALYNITTGYGAGTSAGIIRDMICDMFDELQEHMRGNSEIMWTDDIDTVMDNWIQKKVHETDNKGSSQV